MASNPYVDSGENSGPIQAKSVSSSETFMSSSCNRMQARAASPRGIGMLTEKISIRQYARSSVLVVILHTDHDIRCATLAGSISFKPVRISSSMLVMLDRRLAILADFSPILIQLEEKKIKVDGARSSCKVQALADHRLRAKLEPASWMEIDSETSDRYT